MQTEFHNLDRQYDLRTGRPLATVEVLTDDELEREVTIAAQEPQLRALRLEALLIERTRRREH